MIFSTYKFIFLFFPIVFFGYFFLGRLKQWSLMKIWLVVASLVFYALGDIRFFPIFVMSIFGNYVFGSALGGWPADSEHMVQRKVLLAVGIIANVLLLGYYKYTDFFISNFNFIVGGDVPLRHIVLPIGISFFTFQLIAYLVDSYKGQTKGYNILDYLLFITFFPQLIVGPIIPHAESVPQFEDINNRQISPRNVAIGMLMFSCGCAKKILLADPLTAQAEGFFSTIASTPDMVSAWYYSIEYTISYYFDLSSYADMAIGLGLFFNIDLPINFDSPYKARNFQDYWRRWHITLSRFLGAYVFRSWYDKTRFLHGYYAATMVTFFVSGFWHGAGWTFVVWGLVNGFFVCTASAMAKHGKSWPYLVSFSLTTLGVVLCRILFVAPSFTVAWTVLKGLANIPSLSGYLSGRMGLAKFGVVQPLILVFSIALCWFSPNSGWMRRKFTEYLDANDNRALLLALAAGVMFVVSVMFMNHVASFLYFQF